MPTSGSYDYSATAATIMQAAGEDIGIVIPGQSLDSGDQATLLRTLNYLVKQWQGKSDKFPGLKVWTRQRLSIFFVAGQSRFLVGPASSDDRASVNALSTLLSATKTASATVIQLVSTAGMTAADVIGFVTDAGPIGWGTISTVDSSTQVTIAANSIGQASANNVVYTYTSKAQRFVEIEAAVLRDNSQAGQPIDIPIEIYTDVGQYENITQKLAAGDPTAILVEPMRLNTVVTTNFASPNTYKNLRLTVQYPAEDYDNAAGSDDISYPQEYFAALEWELARRCAPKFGKPWSVDHQNAWQVAVQEGVNLNPDETSLSYEPGRESTDVGSPFTRP